LRASLDITGKNIRYSAFVGFIAAKKTGDADLTDRLSGERNIKAGLAAFDALTLLQYEKRVANMQALA